MASFADIRAKMNSKYGDSEEEKKKQQPEQKQREGTPSATANFDAVRSKMDGKYKPTYDHVDEKYINTFLSDAQSFMNSADSRYTGMGYSNRDSVYEEQKQKLTDLRKRSWDIRQYLNTHKDSMKEEDYTSFISVLDEFDRASMSTDRSFYRKKEGMSKFKNEAAYNEYVRQQNLNNMTSAEIRAEQEARTVSEEDKDIIYSLTQTLMPYDWETAEASGYSKEQYAEVENKRKYIEEKFGVDLHYDIYNNINILNGLMNTDSKIAYTTADGHNVTWEDLYNNAVWREDLDNLLATYSQNSNWDELSKGIDVSSDPNRQSDFDIVFELSQSTVAYDKEIALANGTSEEKWNDIDQKRQYISNKYGVDLYADIYSNDYIFNEIMTMLYDKSWGGNELSAQLNEGIIGDQTFMNMRHLTDDERAVLNYIFFTQGRDAALEWHNSRMGLYQSRAEGKLVSDFAAFGEEHPVLGSLASVGLNLGSSVEYLFDVFDYMATGELDKNSMSLASSSIRSGVMETVDWEIGNWDAFDFVYSTGMSMADSVAATAVGGKAGGVILGLGAAAQATNDALDRGMSNGQAFWNGIAAGVFEGLFESWSIGNFNALKEVASARGKDIAFNIAKSMLVNASEETLTEIANIVWDSIASGDFSQYETLVRQYVVSGMTEEEAKKKAALDLGGQIVEAGASGALMGFGFGAVGSAGPIASNTLGTAVRDIETGKAIMDADGGVDALKAFGSGEDATSKLTKQADKVTGEVATGKGLGKVTAAVKNISNQRAVGKLYRSVAESTVSTQDKADIAKSLESSGFSAKSAKNIADAIAAKLNGKQLTNFQKATLETVEGNKKVEEVVNNLYNDAESSVGKRSTDLKKFNLGISLGVGIAPGGTMAGKAAAEGKDTTKRQPISESHYEASADGKAMLDGQEVNLNGLRKADDGTVMVATSDNLTADPSEVTYPSKGHALVYENYANIETTTNNPVIANMDVEDRSALAMSYNPASGIDAKVWVIGSNQAFWYGFEGISMDENTLPENSLVRSIPNDQRAFAYDLGRKAGERATKTQDEGIKAAVEKAVEKLGGKDAAEAAAKRNEGKVILENKIRESTMTKKQRASYELAKVVSKAVGTNVHVYHGVQEYGKYDTNTGDIWININGNFNGSSMMAFTLSHELVHMAKQWSPGEFKAFADYLLEQYGKKGVSVERLIQAQISNAKLNGYTLNEHEAYEEVIADAAMRMLLDSDAVQKMAAYKEQNPGLWQKIIDTIKKFIDKIRKVFEGAEPDSMEAALYKEFDDAAKQHLEKLFVDMVMDAGEHMSTIRNAFGKGTVVEVNADGEFTLAKGKVDGATKFLYNDYTWETGGRDTLRTALEAEGFSEDDIKAALTIMDGKHELVKELAEQFPEQDRINQATVTTDLKDGHSVLSALVSNGDYPVNIDLLMVCKKRKAYQRVINRLCETGLIQQATVDALAIAEINKILGRYGFETACLGCFVESRRLRIQEWADTIVKEWNSEVKKRNPNAKAFGFGKGEATLTQDEVMQLVGELESAGEKNDQGNLNLGQGSAVKRMGVLLDKVPSLRKTLSIEDLITPDGLTDLRKFDSNLFSMVKSRYGSNSPKFVQEFNPYNHELAKYGKVPSEYKSLREYLYAIGGARMQSFSDFIVENWFDYCQIVADLAARKLPMHTYTKEIALAKLFGLTGIKINMSLIPDIDRSLGKEYAGLTRNAKGELELIWADKDRFKTTGGKSYMQSINFADAIALQNDPRYSANVGTIAVGVSDNHILMMLDDARIRMIIPYHSSGMNPIFADLMGTSFYKDYTMFQNTTVKQIYNSKGQKVTLKLDKTQTGKLTSGFQFNEVLQELGDARAAAQAYKDWCADASKHTITINGETYTAELTPKFDDFSGHENYYKLLEDFNTYDCISEQAARQGDVQQVYPEDFDKILTDELKAQEGHRQKQVANQAFDKAMAEIESYLKNHTKADTVFYAEQHGVKLSAKDKKLGAEDKKKLADLRKGMKNSLPKVPAPTFYSQMAKAVDGMKQEKFGASSVVSMLRGKGVKAEEIKWSGIETFLEGKKSVTKAELQEFIAGSMLQIEEEVLDNKDRPYTEDQQKRLDEYEAKRDEVAKRLADEWKKLTGEEFPIHNAGAGLESSLVNKIIDANRDHKDASFEGRLLKKLRKDLEKVISNNDDFGFDSWKDALRSIHRHRKDFINSYEMSTNDKAIIVKYCNALNAYNELPNKISDEDTDRLRAIARETDPWNRKIMEVKHEHNEEEAKYMTNWREYSLEGGRNYREMLFRIPGSTYSNAAMFTHWKERSGVLAHARVQDMDTFIGKMLFIEEIQSDWHNAGRKDGYDSDADKVAAADKLRELKNQKEKLFEEMDANNKAYDAFLTEYWETDMSDAEYTSRAEKHQGERLEFLYKERELNRQINELEKDIESVTPDAPFKDTYHEYVLKRLIREAAEQDYDSIGWTTAETQDERWQNNQPHKEGTGKSGFLKAYTIEYDQNIRNFMSKFGKKWGTTVGKTVLDNGTEVWSMAITDEMKDSVLYEGQPKYSMPKVHADAVEKFGTTTDFEEAGFILPNGEMLKFTDEKHRGERQYDHRAIGMVYGVDVDLNVNRGYNKESNKHLDDFVEKGGIRFDPGSLEFNFDAMMQMSKDVPITAEQEQAIREFIEWKKQREEQYNPDEDPLSMYRGPLALHIDFGGTSDVALSADRGALGIPQLTYEGGQINANRIIADIRHYYQTGETRKPSVVAQFRYKMPKARTFSYKELVARGSITGEVIKSSDYVRMKGGLLDEAWLVDHVKSKCKQIQTKKDEPTYYAEVPDIGRNIEITRDGILHGGGNYKKNSKGVLPPAAVINNRITVNIVNILKTAIEVNRSSRGDNIDVPFSHIMLGVAGLENADGTVEYYAVRIEIEERVNQDPILAGASVLGLLYAVNAKRISSLHAQVTGDAGVALTTGSFAYNVADLLKDVKHEFNNTFSVDVYRKLKMTRAKDKFSANLLYKTPNSSGMSPRQLLADAFDELVQTPDERKLMDQYRNNISKVEDVQDRLRKLRAEISKLTKSKGDKAKIASMNKTAAELADLIDKYDRKLLDLEASKPLKDVLARAKSAAYREARERSEKDLKEYRQQVSERFDRGVDNRRKTVMRQKIRKVIRDLDKILNRGDKKRNVKEDMKDFVAEALASAEFLFTETITEEDIIRRGFHEIIDYEEEQAYREAYEIIRKLDDTRSGSMDEVQLKGWLSYRKTKLKNAFFRERQRLNKTEVAEVLGKLADAYAKLETSEYAYVNGAFHEEVYQHLKNLQEKVGGAKIKDMTLGQLEELYKAYTMVLTTVQNANKMFAEDLKQSKEELANRVMMEVYQAGGEHGLWSKGQLARNQASWNNTKPIYAAERTGSATFVKLVKGLFKGQYNWATDMEEAKAFRQKVAEKYGFKNWDMEKTYKFTSSSGIEFELNLNQIMSLYAYAKREQAHDHLLKGGFVFGKNTEVVVTKNGIKRTYLNKSAKAHNISDEIMGEIVGKLSEEQRAFVDEMQDYLSTTMGEKGNEVSMRLYGVKLFMEKFYFPLRSAGQFKEKAKEAELKQQQGQISIVNSGFTKAVTPKASNPVVLDGFTDVWAGHVNEMSLYHSMVLPMEDFRRVYNYASPNMEGQESASVNSFIENAYGDAATGYFDQLYNELNGGAIVDPRENLSKKMIGKFKKASVMLSNSVVVQQFSAIGRAYALIDPKYFIGSKVDKKKHAALWNEMKKYAPVAIIKEMGGFDTHTGLSAKDYLLAEKYGKGERVKGFIKDEQYRGDIMGLLPAKADELTWCAIWEAVKRETKAKNSKMDVQSEEFLKKAGERFSEVIEKTQVYDSVLARSANMRSKNGLMQMLTAFMAEPTTTVNMIEDALRKGDKKTIARTFGAVAASILLNNALASLVYAMRDDDEDETFLEKYAQAFASGMLDDINPMTYYPILKDIWSLFQGYDVERTDMAIYSDIADSVKQIVTLIAKYDSEMDEDAAAKYYKEVGDALMSLLDAGASVFGIPWKNVRRDLVSYYNTYKTFARGSSTTWNSFVDAVGGSALDSIPIVGLVAGKSDTEKLYDAIISGDTEYVNRLKGGYKTEDAYNNAVRKALRDNDPRIKAAALAEFNGDSVERMRITKEIEAEGYFTQPRDQVQAWVRGAINAEINELEKNAKGNTPDESTPKEYDDYTVEQYYKAVVAGNQSNADVIYSYLVDDKEAEGYLKHEAEDAIAEGFATQVGKDYKAGKISRSRALQLLEDNTDKDESEVKKWDFELEHGFAWGSRVRKYRLGKLSEADLISAVMDIEGESREAAEAYIDFLDLEMANEDTDITANDAEGYFKYAEPAGITIDVYLNYKAQAKQCKGIQDADGKTISGSKKTQLLDVINSLPITSAQKDALYFANGWAESKLYKEAPWH